MNNIYHDWLVDCVERRKWSWPRIALCLVNTARCGGMTRRELLDGLKRDYQKAAAPMTDAQIESELDSIEPTPMSQEKLDRMLGKIKGTIPFGKASDEANPMSEPRR